MLRPDELQLAIGVAAARRSQGQSLGPLKLAPATTSNAMPAAASGSEIQLFVVVILLGALGGVLHALRSLYWYVGNRNLKMSWLLVYFLLPLIGASFAVVFYVVLRIRRAYLGRPHRRRSLVAQGLVRLSQPGSASSVSRAAARNSCSRVFSHRRVGSYPVNFWTPARDVFTICRRKTCRDGLPQ
jgi:hypothetical protein